MRSPASAGATTADATPPNNGERSRHQDDGGEHPEDPHADLAAEEIPAVHERAPALAGCNRAPGEVEARGAAIERRHWGRGKGERVGSHGELHGEILLLRIIAPGG
jgi:hypothetical protein